MSFYNNFSWLAGIVAFVLLFASGSYLSAGEAEAELGLVPLSELTNSDIDTILAAKDRMRAARLQAEVSQKSLPQVRVSQASISQVQEQ